MKWAVTRLGLAVGLSLGTLACGDSGTEPRLAEAAQVAVSLNVDTLVFGESGTATATVYDGDGQAMRDPAVSWRTSDAGVVQVAANGSLTATGTGSAVITASIGTLVASEAVTVVPRAVDVTPANASVALYEMLVVKLGMDAPALPDAPIAGIVGVDTLWFSATDSSELAALVVGVPSGSTSVVLHLDRNHVASIAVTFEPAAPVGDVEARLETVQLEIDARLSEIDSLGAATGEALPGADFAHAIADEFRTWSDTASPGSRLAVAQFLAAGSQPQPGSLLAASLQSASSASGCIGRFSATGLERRFLQCLALVGIGVGGAVLGSKSLAICNVPATPGNTALCLAALVTTAGGAVLALKSAEVGIKLPGKILDKWIDVVATWFRDRSPAVAGSASLRAAATPLELVSGERYELDTRATYRSVVDSDRTEGGEAATMVELIETFHNGWTAFRELVASLPDVLRSRLPALPASPGTAGAVPAATLGEEVPAEYLSVVNPSAHMAVQFNPTDRSFVATLERGLESDFSFDLAYMSAIDQFSLRVEGKVRTEAAIAVDGGQGQSGEAGAELAAPIVARVTNTVSGAGVAGVTVRWSVLAGGGSISADSSVTDAEGRASVRWTLGESEDEQVVRASAAYANGEPVDQAPVTFTAVTNWPYTLQLMSYHPDYEQMVPERILSRGDAFTTPNGLTRHFRLLRDGQPVGGTQLFGVEQHHFSDETAPLNSATDGHVPDYRVVMDDVVNGRAVSFPLDVTLSSAGYRAIAGRTVSFFLVSSPSSVRHLTLNADGTTVLTVGADRTPYSTGAWTMSGGMATWWQACGEDVVVEKPAMGYAYVPGNYPTDYIILFADGTLGFNSNHSCPNSPDYMRWVIQ